MKVYELYFSPTGSTKKVVKAIAGAWTGEHVEIDFSDPHTDYGSCSFDADDICIIGVPSFGGRVPGVALTHLRAMRAVSTKAVIVTSFGNRAYDDTLLELRDTVKQCGFIATAAIAAVCEHSMMHQFGAGRPNAEDMSELLSFGQKIAQGIENGTATSEIVPSGNNPYRQYGGVPMKPKANKSCNKCGACARACPVRAIPENNPQDTNHDLCITCMRCVSICPEHARHLNAALLFAASQKMKSGCSAPKLNELFL